MRRDSGPTEQDTDRAAGPRASEFGPLPIYSEEQQLEQRSLNELRCVLPPNKFIIRDARIQDFGVDLDIEPVVEDRHPTNFVASVQLKARTGLTPNQNGSLSLSLNSANINYLLNANAAIVILFEALGAAFYWVSVLEEQRRLQSEAIDLRSQKSVTLRFTRRLDSSSVDELHAFLLEQGRLGRTRREQENADQTLPMPEQREPIRAAGAQSNATSSALDTAWFAETSRLRAKTGRIRVIGCDVHLSHTDALPLYLREGTDQESRGQACMERGFEARYLPEHDVRRALVLGSAGLGKSATLRLIAARLIEENRKVLHGSLRLIARRMSMGDSFTTALASATCEGQPDEAVARGLLHSADAILLDGIDEAFTQRSAIAEGLELWAGSFPETRVIVTARPSIDVTALFPSFQPFTLSLPGEHDIAPFVERVAIAMGSPDEDRAARCRVSAAVSSNPEFSTPLVLGFLTALAVSGDEELAATPARLYERVLTLIARGDRADRTYTVEITPHEAHAVLDELAWARHVAPTADHAGLMAHIVRGFKERRAGGDDVLALAERGVTFWEERGVVERVLRPQRDDLEFVHATLQDFAAARRLSQRDNLEIARFAANAEARPEAMTVLSMTASLGSSSVIVEAMLEGSPSTPDRVLACAQIAMHTTLQTSEQIQLVNALVHLIKWAVIPTLAADAGRCLAALVDAGRVDSSLVHDAVGDDQALAEDARSLAALRVRVACIGQGQTGTVSSWIANHLARRTSSDHDFWNRAFSARSYLEEFVPEVIRLVALREGEHVAADLVQTLYKAGGMSANTSLAISALAYHQKYNLIQEALSAARLAWAPAIEESRRQHARDREGNMGFLAALELACEDVVASKSDGSTLAMLMASTRIMEVADVDFCATFSLPKIREALATLLRAWWMALAIDPQRLRGDIAAARARIEAVPQDGLVSAFARLPATPSREPVWTRVDFSDPSLEPATLIIWTRIRLLTPVVLVEPVLRAHPDQSGFIEAIRKELGDPQPRFLAWLARAGAWLNDASLTQRIEAILRGEWPPGAHHLLALLDRNALQKTEIYQRLVIALASDDVNTVEAAAGTLLQSDPVIPSTIAAARAAFERWTARPRDDRVKLVGPRKLEVRAIEPSPRASLASLMLLGSTGEAHRLLDDEDHGVRDIALAHVRTESSTESDLDVVVQNARAPDLINTMIHRVPLRVREITWISNTARRQDLPEQTRLALVDALATPTQGSIPDDIAKATLQVLCEDPSTTIRDRAFKGLRRRAARREQSRLGSIRNR